MEMKKLTQAEQAELGSLQPKDSRVALEVEGPALELAEVFVRAWQNLQKQFLDHSMNCFLRNPMCWIVTIQMSAYPLCNCIMSRSWRNDG